VILRSAARWRRLIPAGAVAAVLAVSYLAPLPSLASNGAGGFGYNCGVKGYGYHDHGMPCPNRPFPGKGEGLAKFGLEVTTTNDEGAGNVTTSSVSDENATSSDENGTSSKVNINTSSSESRGHSQGSSRGRGRQEN
jgi:hypothetical protein